jgi:hypothetical protein
VKKQAKKPPLLPPPEPLPPLSVLLGEARDLGAARERTRTLAILDNFLAAGIPDRDKELVNLIRLRVTGRSVADVVRDETPVVQHPGTTPGPKKRVVA